MNHVRLKAQMNPHPTDQAGKFVTLGRMADQTRRFAQHQQICIFVQNLK